MPLRNSASPYSIHHHFQFMLQGIHRQPTPRPFMFSSVSSVVNSLPPPPLWATTDKLPRTMSNAVYRCNSNSFSQHIVSPAPGPSLCSTAVYHISGTSTVSFHCRSHHTEPLCPRYQLCSLEILELLGSMLQVRYTDGFSGRRNTNSLHHHLNPIRIAWIARSWQPAFAIIFSCPLLLVTCFLSFQLTPP